MIKNKLFHLLGRLKMEGVPCLEIRLTDLKFTQRILMIDNSIFTSQYIPLEKDGFYDKHNIIFKIDPESLIHKSYSEYFEKNWGNADL